MAPHRTAQIAPGLSGVSNTMLWALHNRAIEAARRDSVLDDPGSVHIHQSIDYDFDRHFGIPSGSLAARAAGIDQALRQWIDRHPDGTVISLGEGLETQSQRVDNGRVRWLSVDLPEAISLRERFLTPTDRFRHIAISALDPAWMDAVDPMADVFIVAQGLLMYLQPAMVQALFANIGWRTRCGACAARSRTSGTSCSASRRISASSSGTCSSACRMAAVLPLRARRALACRPTLRFRLSR